MSDDILPDFLSHDQVIASIQRYYDMLWEIHDDCVSEENHGQKEIILGLLDIYAEIFEVILCHKR